MWVYTGASCNRAKDDRRGTAAVYSSCLWLSGTRRPVGGERVDDPSFEVGACNEPFGLLLFMLYRVDVSPHPFFFICHRALVGMGGVLYPLLLCFLPSIYSFSLRYISIIQCVRWAIPCSCIDNVCVYFHPSRFVRSLFSSLVVFFFVPPLAFVSTSRNYPPSGLCSVLYCRLSH